MVQVTLPDGNTKDLEGTPLDLAKNISDGLARATLAAKVDGILVDATKQLTKNCAVELLTAKDPDGMHVLRHSCAHLLAHAIKRLYPDAKPTIGPVIDHGFYYDFDNLDIHEEDLPKIEAEMKKIVKEKLPVERIEYGSKKEAAKDYLGNEYKQELIEESDGSLSAYRQGDFLDLCRGPHVPNTKVFEAFKLTHTAGAYWRGDAKNTQLTRIYGLCFATKKELQAHVEMLEEAAKRDHRKLGKEQDLLMFHEYSPGSPFFLPKGAILYNELMTFIREEYRKRGYQEVVTPLLYDKALWQTSGHWEHFQEDMFTLKIDGRDFGLKPMNCPSHLLMYMSKYWSYRDLPLRIADFAPLHRNELKGVLQGLTRVRKFSQDDSHTFCTEEQIGSEISGLLDFMRYVYHDVFGFRYEIFLSTKPEKAMGDAALWEHAEATLQHSLEAADMSFTINEGDGAFYGPKIDVRIRDALDRPWQLATIQLDFQMPKRFGATYEGADGKKHTPIMIHKAILGSLERFIGVMIEHYAGKFPLWLSPEQVRVITVADRHLDYANDVAGTLRTSGLRVHVDNRTETINKKIREAQLAQVNYILVVGDKELENNTVTVRTRDNQVHGATDVESLRTQLSEEVTERR